MRSFSLCIYLYLAVACFLAHFVLFQMVDKPCNFFPMQRRFDARNAALLAQLQRHHLSGILGFGKINVQMSSVCPVRIEAVIFRKKLQ